MFLLVSKLRGGGDFGYHGSISVFSLSAWKTPNRFLGELFNYSVGIQEAHLVLSIVARVLSQFLKWWLHVQSKQQLYFNALGIIGM